MPETPPAGLSRCGAPSAGTPDLTAEWLCASTRGSHSRTVRLTCPGGLAALCIQGGHRDGGGTSPPVPPYRVESCGVTLVVRARRVFLPDAERPAAVHTDGGRIAAITGYDA